MAGIGYGLFHFKDSWLPFFLPGEKKEQKRIKIGKISRATIQNFVVCNGEISPELEVEIKSEVGARVKTMHVSVGDKINQGQILVELDDSELLSEKLSIESEIEGRRLELDKAKRDMERNRQLYEKKLVAEKTYLDSMTEEKMAANRIQQSERRLQTILERLRKTKLYAPVGGKILEINVIEGQVVVSAQSVNSGTLLMKLAKLERMLIYSHVNQVEVQELAIGMKGDVKVESIKDAVIAGEIIDVSPVATTVRNVKGFKVTILIASPPPNLKPGMTAEASFLTKEVQDALAAPISAVYGDRDQGFAVYVLKSEEPQTFQKRTVETGISDLDRVEITGGVHEGEAIALRKPEDSL